VVKGRAATIEDLESKNGTFVNGERISKPTRLAIGDEIGFGPGSASFRFVLAGEPTLPA
jgi:pSer/pThr/pTyr-binding forkhead associated (FHA) protein